MAYKHSPEKLVGQRFADAKRDWFPWHHTLLSSHAFGRVDPILCEPVTGYTTVKLDMKSALQTNPTATPLFDSATITDSVFFVPQRILSRGLNGDNILELDDIESIPTIPVAYNKVSSLGQISASVDDTRLILPGSLLNRLGYPAAILTPANTLIPLDTRHFLTTNKSLTISSNASINTFDSFYIDYSSVFAYYLICERYFTTPVSPYLSFYNGYMRLTYDASTSKFTNSEYSFYRFTNFDIYSLRDWIMNVRGIVNSSNSTSISSLNYLFGYVNDTNSIPRLNTSSGSLLDLVDILNIVDSDGVHITPASASVSDLVSMCQNQISSTGIWPAMYDDHYQTMFFDKDDIDSLEYSTSTELGDSVTTARIARSRFNRIFRSILRGRKFTDWVDIHFGAKLKTSDHPIFVGSNQWEVVFDDVLNTNGAGDSETPLGTAASRGKGLKPDSKEISFTTQEPGYIIAVRTIVPKVSYSSVMPRWASYKTFASFPMPEYSATTFQDLKVSDVVTTFTPADDYSFGKVPLYFDYMAKYNRLHGVFATHLNESYTFKREVDCTTYDSESLWRAVRNVYIDDNMFNYNFPSIGGVQQAENIFIKTKFNMRVFQPIDRSVLQTRS